MRLKGHGKSFETFVAILIVGFAGAALSGCGGASDDSASTSSSNGSSSSSSAAASASNVALSSSTYLAAPASSALVTIYRTGSTSGTTTVGYTTIDGSAAAGTNYVATSGTVSWQAGDASSRTVIVPVASSASGKSFAFVLTDPQGKAILGQPNTAVVMVLASVVSAPSPGGGSSGSGSGSASATLSWLAPSENTNGSALTNLAGYNIYYGTSTSAMTNRIAITSVAVMTYVINNLNSGNWFFAITAVNSAGVESLASSAVEATL
jgi:hypothetical protein